MIAVSVRTDTYPADTVDVHFATPVAESSRDVRFGGVVEALRWLEAEGITTPSRALRVGPWTQLRAAARRDEQGRLVVVTAHPVPGAARVEDWTRLVGLVKAVPVGVAPNPDRVPGLGDLVLCDGQPFGVAAWLRRVPRSPVTHDVGPDRCPLEYTDRERAQYVLGVGDTERVMPVDATRVVARPDRAFLAAVTSRYLPLIGRAVGDVPSDTEEVVL